MKIYTVAVVGCGKGGKGVGGHSIGYAHGTDWNASPRARLAGACDLNQENLQAFCRHFEVPVGRENFATMLEEVRPDIVSICTYAGARPSLVEACAKAGVKGIWCEKPFSLSMSEARKMVAQCDEHGVKMIVNHCRRPLPLLRRVKDWLAEGKIGEPMLFAASLENWDQMEWGTHWHDIFRLWAGDQPVTWVMGQARSTGARTGYGHIIEDHSLGYYSFADGTRALLDGGIKFRGNSMLSVLGTEGAIHIKWDNHAVLINRDGLLEVSDLGSAHPHAYGSEPSLLIPHSLIDWLEGGTEPELSAANALKSTEVYLAIYESAKQGNRIDLPLETQADFPLNAIAARQRTP
jgi:predicted dehydrogenase